MFEEMEPVEFEHEGTGLRGYAARPDATGPLKGVPGTRRILAVDRLTRAAQEYRLGGTG